MLGQSKQSAYVIISHVCHQIPETRILHVIEKVRYRGARIERRNIRPPRHKSQINHKILTMNIKILPLLSLLLIPSAVQCFTAVTGSSSVYEPRSLKKTRVYSSQENERTSSNYLPLIGRREAVLGSAASLMLLSSGSANAAITDETENFAVIGKDDPYKGYANSPPPTSLAQFNNLPSDEITIKIPKRDLSGGGLGLELGQIDFRTNIRVYVKSIQEDSLASRLGIKKDWIVVSVNGESAERTNAQGVGMMVGQAVKSSDNDIIELKFRDPSMFQQKLGTLSSDGGTVTTQVAPAGDTTQRNPDGSIRTGTETSQTDQRVSISQLISPNMCRRQATTDDLLEISYLGTVLDTGNVFDGSAIRINGEGIPGRANDVSLFFVLGKQPFGQFPPGWDVGLDGMCVGERRRIIIPPVLAYGSVGLPRRGIPPNATLQYDVTLVSINGLATP